jgi:PAS domain S-box-containing protein
MPVGLDPNDFPLQKVLRDLVALSAVPSVWVGRESRGVADDLADLLATSLNLDFAFVHLRDSSGSAAAEVGTAPPAVLERVRQYRDGRGRLSHPEIVPGAVAGNDVQGGGILLPLGVNAEFGLIAAASDRPDFPGEIDQLLLSVAACHGTTASKMAGLVEEQRRTETALAASERRLRQAHDQLEMKVAERTAELRRSETYLAEAEKLSHTGTWAVNLKGERTIVYASEESYRIYGLDPRQGLPKHDAVWQRVHPDDRTWLYEKIQEAERQKRDYLVEFRILLPDGAVKYVEEIGHHVFSERGELLERMGIHVDVTERKRAQEALRESEAKFRDYAESASDWFWEIGTDLKFTMLTANAFGSNGAARIGTACWDHALDLETEPEKWRLVRATLESRKPFRDFVYCTTGGNGSPMYVKAAGIPVFDADGKFRGYRGTGTDVTASMRAQAEREQLTQELQRREAYLAEAERLSHTGSFGWKPKTDEIVWSDETYSIFEYQRSIKPTLDLVAQRVHPQDRADLQKVIADASRGAAEFEHTYRLLLPDGRVKHVHALAHALQDASGNREFVGAVTDITERKTAEKALRTSEAYLAEAQRLSHTGSWAWSPDTDLRHWSEECYRILGFDPRDGLPVTEELIQRIHPDDQPAFRESTNRAKHKKLDEEVDYRIVHPGGAVRDIHSIGHPVFSPSGDLVEFRGTVIDITERKRAEQDLRASERKYRHLVDTTPAFIHTALPNGSLDFLSRGWLKYGGLPQSEFLDWRWTAAIHPEDVEGFVDKWRAALASGEPFVAESRVRRADGEYRWFLQRNVPLRDESGNIVKWYGTGFDIEERKRAEESLRSSEAYLAEVQKLSHTGSWAWSPDEDIRYWSEECYRVLSFDPRDGLPRFEQFLQRIHPDDQAGFRELIETAIREKAEWKTDYRIVHPDGLVRDIHVLGHPVLSTSGHLIEFVGTVIDVTERKRAEQERARLRQLEADLAHINRVSTLGEMAASLAHEVKQPIAAARNNARAALNFLAKKRPDLGEVREALGCIVGDADRAGDIIDRIRDHTKKAPARKDRFDLNEAITEVVELAQSAIAKHAIALEMRLANELCAVQGDRVQLQQVILNLTLNAIEAMSEVDGPRELSISTEQRETIGLVSVRDSGPGIDPEKRERVFEAFYTTKSNGVGIGLSICRSIIDAHAGRLWIEANEPRGASFQFSVPSAASELRSSSASFHQTQEPYEHSVSDAAHQRVSAGNTRPPHLARGPRRRHRGKTS